MTISIPRSWLICGLTLAVSGCASGTDLPNEGETATRSMTLSAPLLEAYSFEGAPSDPLVTQPHVYLKNNTGEMLHGFTYYYYVKTEEGKELDFTVIEAPGIDVYFERVDGEERLDGDYYRVKYDCTNCPIEPGAIHPNPQGISVEISNADDSAWNKSDDPSATDAEDFEPNPLMPVYDNGFARVAGNEPDIDWPADVEPVDPGDTQIPLPQSLQYEIPPFAGNRYADQVPATLDLAAMAELSLRGMTQTVDFESSDQDVQYTLMFTSDWNSYPPFLHHEEGSDAGLGKFMGPLLLNQLLTGTDDHLDLFKKILNQYLRHYHDNTGHSGSGSRLYEGLIFNYFRDPERNPMWKTLVQQAVQGMIEQLVVPEGTDYGYWPSGHEKNSFWAQDPWREQVLLMAYKQLGYGAALDAVRKHINWARYESGVWSDDGGIQNEHEHGNPHFHGNALYLQPFLDYALLVKDAELIEFVQRAYEWAKSDSPGSVAGLGYFPEFVTEQENSETCPITDMIMTGMELSLAGIHDYWDDVDTYVRNHFAEAQLTEAKAECLENWSRATFLPWNVEHELGGTHNQASERSIGGFAGWPTFNEWKHRENPGIQQCCTGNGARTVYHVWANIITLAGSTLRVNLPLNRAAQQADVYSHLPYQGKLEVKPKIGLTDVRIRIPGGHTTGISVKVGSASRSWSWEAQGSRYIKIGGPYPIQQRISVTFPNPTTTEEYQINDEHVTVQKKGNTVVSFSPGGQICPLYANRAGFMSNTAPIQAVERFVSSEPNVLKQVDTTWELPVSFLSSPGHNSGWAEDGDEMVWVDFTGELLLDGDQSKKSRWSATDVGKYALFKLNRLYTVKYVNLATPEDDEGERRERHFEIQVAGNDQVFRSVLSATTSGLTTTLEGFALNGGGATGVRYVKLIGHGNHHGPDFDPLNEFTELEIWGTASDPAAPLGVASISASEYVGGNTPQKTRDNNVTGSYWLARGDGEWISYELAPAGTTRSLTAVDIAFYRGNTRIQYFDVQTSMDGENWTLIFKGQSSGTSTQFQSFDLPNLATRHVRIVGHKNSRNDEIALAEVRIKGY